MARALRPRPPVALSAAMVSQLTSLPLLGIDPRRYLDLVVPLAREHVIAIGKLRPLPLDVAVEALRGLAAGDEQPAEPAADEPRQPETGDDVLRALGLERAR